jgi:hypothetical protein
MNAALVKDPHCNEKAKRYFSCFKPIIISPYHQYNLIREENLVILITGNFGFKHISGGDCAGVDHSA